MKRPLLHTLIAGACIAASASLAQGQALCPTPGDYTNSFSLAGEHAGESAIGDFNSDGHQDIAVVSVWNDRVDVHYGNGDGTFQSPVYGLLPPGSAPARIDAGSYWGTHDSIVVGNLGTNSVSRFDCGDGIGDAVNGPGVSGILRDVAMGPNGMMAMAVENTSGSTTVIELTSSWGSIFSWTVPGVPSELTVAQLVPNAAPEYVWGGHGRIWITKPNGLYDYWIGGTVTGIAVGDVQGDGHADLAFTLDNDQTKIYWGNSTGDVGFGPVLSIGECRDVEIGDFTGDGQPDLAVLTDAIDQLLVIPQVDGVFWPWAGYPVMDQPAYLAVGDFDGNCQADFVATGLLLDEPRVLLSGCGPHGACVLNDCCSMATEAACLALGGQYAGDSIDCGSTDAYFNVQHVAMGASAVAPSFEQDVNCFGNLERVKWFRFDATFNGQINAQFCHATDYTWFGYSAGDPYPNAVGNCAQCNVIDQGCFDGCKQSHTLGVVAGTSYYFAVYTIVPVEGTFTLSGTCDADLAQDYEIGIDDLLVMLSIWGDCVDCQADLNNDDAVDFLDLLTLLGMWGPCGSP